MKKIRSSAGFTLIELLVVIGILGILASALIATIDPFEQLKKAQDANVKNAAVEFVNANIRYYTTHNALPWADTANTLVGGCTLLAMSAATDITLNPANTNIGGCLNALIGDGELKTGFTTVGDTLKKIYISSGTLNPDNNIVACFQPQSKSQAKDANCKYGPDGEEAGTSGYTSKTPGAANECFWCAQ